MESSAPVVCLLRCALNCYGWRCGAEKWGSYRVVRVQLFKGVVNVVDGLGWLVVEGVIVLVCGRVCD